MKRSEMVSHVIKTLYPNDIEISLYEQNRISKILKIIEEAGMLPPQVGEYNVAQLTLDPSTDDATCIHFWETEDE